MAEVNDETEVTPFAEDEMLWRNVHPGFWDQVNNQPSSQAFRPTPKDGSKLSVARSRVVTADEHFHEFTVTLRLMSSGVWGVTVQEALGESLGLDHDESRLAEPHPKGHTSVLFGDHSRSQWERIARRLRGKAMNRGRHAPSEEPGE